MSVKLGLELANLHLWSCRCPVGPDFKGEYCIARHYTALHWTALHLITQHCTTLHYTVLHCTHMV